MTLGLEPADRREEVRVRKQRGIEQRERLVVDVVAQRRLILYRLSQLIGLAGGVLETLLGLRVVLKLIAANPEAAFARFLYSFTFLFLRPFAGLTPDPTFEGMVLETSTLIAMVVYALATWVVLQAIWLLFYRTYTSSVSTYRRVQ